MQEKKADNLDKLMQKKQRLEQQITSVS